MMITGTSSRSGGLKRPFEYRLLAYATAASAGVLGVSAPALADFSGAYDYPNWTITLTNSNGSVTDGTPDSITVIGPNKGSCDSLPCGAGSTDFTIAAAAAGVISFDWGYTSNDTGTYDEGGYLLNGVYTHLAFNQDAPTNGSASFGVSLGDVFGFRVNSADNFAGAGLLTIRSFEACAGTAPCDGTVPEPGTLALLAAGLLGAVATRRAKRRVRGAEAN